VVKRGAGMILASFRARARGAPSESGRENFRAREVGEV
jgi:hypothetical protein